MTYYVYSTRCQPLNLLIEKEIRWLAENILAEDKIIIGIVNPNPIYVDKNDKANTWTRFKEAYNPLNYWERFCMLVSFLNSAGLSEKVAAIVPLARPSTNMKHAKNYLPENRIMCLPIAQQSIEEDQKRDGMEDQGERIFEIPSYTFPENVDVISPELIFCLMAIGNDQWKTLISPDTLSYLESRNIVNRVVSKMTFDTAQDNLSKIYKRTVKDEDKALIAQMLSGYNIKGVPNVPRPPKPIMHDNEQYTVLADLKKDVERLRMDISVNLPPKDIAPESHAKFTEAMKRLSIFWHQIDSGSLNTVEQIQIIEQYYNEVKAAWQDVRK